MVRVAEAAVASGCVLLDSLDLTGPKFLRATMGSCFRLPCARAGTDEFLRIGKGLRILAAVGPKHDNSIDFRQADYTSPVAICIGAEGAGLSRELLTAAKQRIFIPMSGRVESLNAAVAAGIILYRARDAWVR